MSDENKETNSPLEKGVRGLLHSEIKSITIINEKYSYYHYQSL